MLGLKGYEVGDVIEEEKGIMVEIRIEALGQPNRLLEGTPRAGLLIDGFVQADWSICV